MDDYCVDFTFITNLTIQNSAIIASSFGPYFFKFLVDPDLFVLQGMLTPELCDSRINYDIYNGFHGDKVAMSDQVFTNMTDYIDLADYIIRSENNVELAGIFVSAGIKKSIINAL